MKFIKLLLAAISVYSCFIVLGTSFSGCTKQIEHDTTTITLKDTIVIKDTITIKDTVTIIDTLCNLNDGLVAYYNFNGGNINDSSGYNNNIIFNGATPTADRFGNSNNAYLFDGKGSYMQVKNSPSINPNNITMFAIVKVKGFYTGECNGNQILGKGYPDDINGFYRLSFFSSNNGDPTSGVCYPTIDTTKELFGGTFGDDVPQGYAAGAWSATANDSLFVQKDQWYALTYTYDGAVSKFYVNGSLISTYANTHTVTFTPNSYDLFIGKDEDTIFPYYFNGVIDEVRIYNKAIPDQKIGYLNILKDKYLKVQNKLVY